MSKPTARELLARVSNGYGGEVAGTLAARVTEVMAYLRAASLEGDSVMLALQIQQVLDGEEPM